MVWRFYWSDFTDLLPTFFAFVLSLSLFYFPFLAAHPCSLICLATCLAITRKLADEPCIETSILLIYAIRHQQLAQELALGYLLLFLCQFLWECSSSSVWCCFLRHVRHWNVCVCATTTNRNAQNFLLVYRSFLSHLSLDISFLPHYEKHFCLIRFSICSTF